MRGRTRLAGLALVYVIAGCGGTDRPGRGTAVVLITIDTLRADRLGVGGDAEARTPQLDRLARRGTQWARALATTPLTLPSHATILSGRIPPEHGARDNGLYRVSDGVPLISEVLHDAGWRTAAFVAAYPLASRFGLARGFDTYNDEFGTRQDRSLSSFAERPAHRVNAEVRRWLADTTGDPAPAFLWVHYFDPHSPYLPPRIWNAATRRDPYRGEIAFTDHRLGELMRMIRGEFSAVRIVITADHGESLGQHDEDSHGVFLYEATTRVPLLMTGDDLPVGRLVGAPVSLERVAPTLATLANVAPDDFPARPLTDPTPADAGSDDAVYLESLYPRLRHGWSELRAFRTGRWKVIQAPRPEVYDLALDPGELTNLYETDAPARMDELLERLGEERFAATDPTSEPDAEVEEALRSLGYASVADPGTHDFADPKDRIGISRALSEAGSALEARQLPAARRALTVAQQIEPNNKEAMLMVARLEGYSGNITGARDLLERCLTLPPASTDALVHYEAGRLELDAGNLVEAERRFEITVRLDPLNVDARFNWGLAAYRDGRFGRAAERWAEALRLDPQHGPANTWLAEAQAKAQGGNGS